MNQNVADIFIFIVFVRQKLNTVTILNTAARISVRGKEESMFPGILFSTVISVLIKILKRGSPGLHRDHPSSWDLPVARIQPTVLLELR
jgi:hypothetical protein